MKVISINGHLRVAVNAQQYTEVLDVYPLHGFIVMDTQQYRFFFNQDGQEVFRVEHEKGFWKRFLSWVRLR